MSDPDEFSYYDFDEPRPLASNRTHILSTGSFVAFAITTSNTLYPLSLTTNEILNYSGIFLTMCSLISLAAEVIEKNDSFDFNNIYLDERSKITLLLTVINFVYMNILLSNF